MSINEFHSKFAAQDDQTPWFTALRKLSEMDPRMLMAESEAERWPSWEASRTAGYGAQDLSEPS
jgi:hypothetical protein